MLQLFRSFQWSGALAVALLAAVVRAPAFALGIPAYASDAHLGPWGSWLAALHAYPLTAWVIGLLLVTLVGVIASYTLQDYRLGSAGAFPALIAVLLGSAAWWWLGLVPSLVATLLVAAAAHRLFAGYRHQGDALPVYDCGLLLGAAALVSAPFVWFVLWGMIAIAQLRKFRVAEIVGLVFGTLTLPLLMALYCFVFGDFEAFRQNLFAGAVQLPNLTTLAASWPAITVLALTTGATVGAFGRLTTRRPIQEQRAARMLYTMLPVGWIALFFSGIPVEGGLALLLYPLCALLGLWLSELSRKRAEMVTVVLVALIASGLAYSAIMN